MTETGEDPKTTQIGAKTSRGRSCDNSKGDRDRQAMILRLPKGDREMKIFRLLNKRPRQTVNDLKTTHKKTETTGAEFQTTRRESASNNDFVTTDESEKNTEENELREVVVGDLSLQQLSPD